MFVTLKVFAIPAFIASMYASGRVLERLLIGMVRELGIFHGITPTK
jgi:hypothetical protein